MYIYGSGFYALYFIVSFPMFARIDEWPNLLPKFSLSQSAIDSFGACMIITLLLDFWRLSIGPIFQNTIKQDDVQVPFIY